MISLLAPLAAQALLASAPSTPQGAGPHPEALAAFAGDFPIGPALVDLGSDIEGDGPTDLAYTADGSRYVVSHALTNNLTVFDAATNSLLFEVPLSGSPVEFDISPDGLWAATANAAENTLSLLDVATWTEQHVVPVGEMPLSIEFTPDSQRLVARSFEDPELSVVDVSTGVIQLTVPSGKALFQAYRDRYRQVFWLDVPELFCMDSSTAMYLNTDTDTLDFVDLDTGALDSMALGGLPRNMGFTAGTPRVVATASGRVKVINPFTRTLLRDYDPSFSPKGAIAVQPGGAFAAVGTDDGVMVMRLSNGNEGNIASSLTTAYDILLTNDGSHAISVNSKGSLISFAQMKEVGRVHQGEEIFIGAVSPIADVGAFASAIHTEKLIVSDLDPAQPGVLLEHPTGGAPEFDGGFYTAISEDGSIAIVLHRVSANATVLDPRTGAILGRFEVEEAPQRVGITPDKTKAVVTSYEADFVTIVDLSTFETASVEIGDRTSHVLFSPDSRYAYVARVATQPEVWRIDLDLEAPAGPPAVLQFSGSAPSELVDYPNLTLTPDGTRLFVLNNVGGAFSVINTSSWTPLPEVVTGLNPVLAEYIPGTDRFIVATTQGLFGSSGELILFKDGPGPPTELGRVPVSLGPQGLLVDDGGSYAYTWSILPNLIGATALGSISVVDIEQGAEVFFAPTPDTPTHMEWNAASGEAHLYLGKVQYAFGNGPNSGLEVIVEGRVLTVDPLLGLLPESTDTGQQSFGFRSGGGRYIAPFTRSDDVLIAPQDSSLRADSVRVSTEQGGTQSLSLRAGPSFGSDLYLVLGSASGFSPGVDLGGVALPLNVDGFLLNSISKANTGVYQSTLGVLDAEGCGGAAIAIPPQVATPFVGTTLSFAFCALEPVIGTVNFASNPVTLTLEP